MTRAIDPDTPPSLLVRIRDHADAEAWTQFVDVYSPLLYSFCRIRGLQASDAADITQETLLRVSKAIGKFDYDPQRGLFRDWLARIVLNEIRRLTTRKQLLLAQGDDHDQEIHHQWNMHFHQRVFTIALTRSKPHFEQQTWDVFQRSWLEKVPVDVVAQEFGIEKENVYVARSRVLKRLRQETKVLADDLL